jgi:uncharacterized protein YjbI with pentapeptide repeats
MLLGKILLSGHDLLSHPYLVSQVEDFAKMRGIELEGGKYCWSAVAKGAVLQGAVLQGAVLKGAGLGARLPRPVKNFDPASNSKDVETQEHRDSAST